MSRKKSYLTATDGFCGAGGSSQGAQDSGVEVVMALNHWKLAIETHNTNFPNTNHDCTDISASDPRRYPSTDIGIWSPECTTHTPAGGNNHKTLKRQMEMFDTCKIDPSTERSRATMWDVCRFTEYHRYNIVIVENVVEAKTRWPLFDTWLSAMHVLGYYHKCVYLNSMHCHPTPQSRDRMYVVFWKKGNKAPMLEYTPLANCQKCGKDVSAVQTWKNTDRQYGKYKQQYVYCCSTCTSTVDPYYYASFNCIDWSDLGLKIGERVKPLAPKTIQRIEYGRKKFGNNPYVIKLEHSQRVDNVHSIKNAFSAQTGRQSSMLINPFIIKGEHCNVDPQVRQITDVTQTQVTRQTMSLFTPPFIIIYKGQSTAKVITDPLTSQTTEINHAIISDESFKSFISHYYGGSNCVNHITEAIGTVGTVDGASLLTYKQASIEDSYYRMIKPPEVKRAMAFRDNYVILGNSRDQVKQLGNAVTPPAMKWLVQQAVETFNS